MEERQFNPDKTQDLFYFAKVLKKAINENGLCREKGKKGSFSSYWSGYWYYDTNKIKKKYWAGLVHIGEERIHNFWIKKLNCKKKRYGGKFKYGKFYNNGVPNTQWFCLKNKYFNDIVCEKKDFKQKFKIIKGFIREVAKIK